MPISPACAAETLPDAMSEEDRPATWRRILLTGGTGFVGAYLAPAIVAAYPAADRLLLRRPGETVERAGWTAVDEEIDAAALRGIVADFRPDLVLHLAAQASVGAAARAPELTWKVNYEGTLNLARACRPLRPTFIFVSSSEVYGESFRDGPADESTPLRPMSVYAETKAAAEAALPDVLRGDARLIVVRPFNHTGVGQDLRFVLPSFAAQVAEIEAGRRAPRLDVGNVDAVRDFLDVHDVCAAYLAVLALALHLPRLGEAGAALNVFNVASGNPRRIGDLIALLRRQAAVDFEVRVDPARLRPSDIAAVAGTSARLERLTGWRPVIPMERTLGEMLDHFRASLPRWD
jgi:GDP-4-dehydro-6-deoxy-D-mannose reductase